MVRLARLAPWIAFLAILCTLAPPLARPSLARGTITLDVDASQIARQVIHTRLVIPATPGPLTLLFPKWIPGEHEPSGPIAGVTGIRFMAAGETLSWQRDLVDLNAFHCDVPASHSAVEVQFDFMLPTSTQGFSYAASATPELGLLSWNQVVLYPAGDRPADLRYKATLRVPWSWKIGTALPTLSRDGETAVFDEVSLETLVDSPVLMGANFRTVALTPGQTPGHFMDMAADSKAALEIPDDQIAAYRRLVDEAQALFGARHYRQYRFLITLSDNTAHFGLEHHESSDDRFSERMWIDDDMRTASSNLLSHEYVHSWNGKYRRPADLATPDYQQPMRDDLLWVYEGLTDYYAAVLGARSGARSAKLTLEYLALWAAYLDHRPGRTWRPLIDCAVAEPLNHGLPIAGVAWRRGTDFYQEGVLIWLEADVTIRKLSMGKRSLDDFCRAFHGGTSGPPRVEPYTFADVVATMNAVQPYDWKTFFTTRLESLSPHAPMGGIEGGGWHVAYSDSMNPMLAAGEHSRMYMDLSFSLGIRVDAKTGELQDVIPGAPAAQAGMIPGMTLVAVNGRKWTREGLKEAIRANQNGSDPIELLVENDGFYKTFKLEYYKGARYPHLVRTPGQADLLGQILKPLRGGSSVRH